jgi:hypothetical protein
VNRERRRQRLPPPIAVRRPFQVELFAQPVKARVNQESTAGQSKRRQNNHRHINMGDAKYFRRHEV